MIKRKFGWKPDYPSFHANKYALHKEMNEKAAPELPLSVSLVSQMSPIEDQGNLGSCVAHATVGALQYLELLDLKLKDYSQPEIFPSPAFLYEDISRLFVYYNARIIDGDPNVDNGTQISSAISAIQKWGICIESQWPYNENLVNVTPIQSTYDAAKRHPVLWDYKLNNVAINELKQCLAQGFPFVFGISVYSSFMTDQVAQTGIVPMPSPSEQLQGGHALCCVGYDDSKQAFIVRNSWGTNWGIKGYCLIPYSYLNNTELASDFWTLRKQT